MINSKSEVGASGRWVFECRGPDGAKKWTATTPKNLVVDQGLDYLIDAGLSGGSQVSSWYLGLINATPVIASSNTMASHSPWIEVQNYDEAVRPLFIDDGVSSQTVTNSASPAVFTMNASVVVGGAFLVSDNVKGGAAGVLYSASAFLEGDQTVGSGDTITLTSSFSVGAS